MKKSIVLLFLCLIVVYLGADEILQPAQQSKDFEFKGKIDSKISIQNREQDPPPNYSFILNGDNLPTTYLYDSYYDYMPFSYNGHNIRLQPEISLPYGYSAGGFYISYMCSETSVVEIDRRAWNSYVNPDGTLLVSSGTNHYGEIREGFTSVDIDPYTGDPLFVWHSVVEDDNSYDCSMTYDNYHLTGATGYWKIPFIVIDNPEVGEPFTGHADDEFIWPGVMIGDSPLADHRRVHIYGNNYTSNPGGGWGYNTLYGYADFNADSLLYESEFDWTYRTFPYFDNMHYNDLGRSSKDIIVKGNKVAFFGAFSGGDSLFCMYSDDYGENFTLYSQEWLYPVENPLQEDGIHYEFYDNDETTPSVLFFTLSYDGSHFNGAFTDNDTKIVWMSGINMNSQENIDASQYWPAYFYPKIFMFDIDTGIFSFYDMDIQGADPADDQPAIPWDLDEDGVVDEFYDDGSVYIPLSMPSWFYNTDQGYQDAFFHESAFRMVANENWIVAGWHDCKKLRWAYWGEDGYDGWIKQPELAISISKDCGETWSEIRYINANPNDAVIDEENHYDGNYAPEFEDMLPVYLAFGGELEVLGDEHAKLHIGFFDDNDYGGAAGPCEGAGQLNGGKLRYAALDIDFQPGVESTDDNTIAPGIAHLGQNYPNPFNPSVAGRSPETTIQYNLKKAADVKINIFNIKGQKVKTLVNEHKKAGDHFVRWDGKDLNNKSVSSGLYFYTLSADKCKTTKKMILLR